MTGPRLEVLEGGKKRYEAPPGLRGLVWVILWLAVVGLIAIGCALTFLVVVFLG